MATYCKFCNSSQTWLTQRGQYGRLKKKGVSDEEIKNILPRCPKCVTAYFAPSQPWHHPPDAPLGPDGLTDYERERWQRMSRAGRRDYRDYKKQQDELT